MQMMQGPLPVARAQVSEVRKRESATPRNHHDMLSSRLLRQPVRQSLSRNPAISSPARCRLAFHASAPRRDPVLDAILYLPHEMMNLIHTGAPWYAAIPLTAFITRGMLVTTAGAWARSLTARYIGLHPLRQALAFQKRDAILRTSNFRDPKQAMLAVKKEVRDEVAKLDKRWNVTLTGQISWTFVQIPLFFAMAETIRQKSGAHDGLLGMGFSSIKGEDITLPDDVALPDGDVVTTTSHWFEPSLANEGMLWFPDLLLPDPTGALPFLVSGLMFANIYYTKNTVQSDARWPSVIRNVLLGVALLVGPICQHLPSALMLYWGSSTASVMLWNVWLDWKYPAPRGFTACRRPLLMPPVPAPRGRKV
jgi:inner membrane protein COX18